MMKMKCISIVVILLLLSGGYGFKPAEKLYTLNIRSASELKDFFKYTPDRIPFVSAHRGGPRKGFPENCIPTFENTLKHAPAILEVDPHYTKDGKIVLMHDPTLNRTSNGTGKISDYTLEELKRLRLKDTEGNLTNYQMPTLDEALQWAKGKTILVIDAKDVPIEVRAQKIRENNAESCAMVISYSLEDTKKCFQLNPDIVMEVMAGKIANLEALDKSGVRWENMVGFVSHELPKDKVLSDELHKRGAMSIMGSSRNYDRQFITKKISAEELGKGYLSLTTHGADIIEADLGIEAAEALKPLQKIKSSKSKYFRK